MATVENIVVWRYLVLQQGDNKCAKCGVTANLHAHHVLSIKDRPDLKFALDNGLALCAKCHRKLHATERAASPKQPAIKNQLITLRIDPVELENLRRTFGSYGVTLAGGMKLAAHYVIKELKAGRLDLSKAGLLPGERGR